MVVKSVINIFVIIFFGQNHTHGKNAYYDTQAQYVY